ncbi:PAS domain-containing protein [Allorhizobium undicola]|uniref:PAS domain-containing protein n=1 Tax=Allorhizobium undicola TaxID=78527 RepID=UPI003D341476
MRFIINEEKPKASRSCPFASVSPQDMLDLMQSVEPIGVWRIDIDKGHFYGCDSFHMIFESEPQTGPLNIKHFASRVHPDDIGMLMETFQRICETGETYHAVHRVIKLDGSLKYVRAMGAFRPAAHGSGEVYGLLFDLVPRVCSVTFFQPATSA